MPLPMTGVCSEHNDMVREQVELGTLFRSHAENTKERLERILDLLQGSSGKGGLSDRVTRLEAQLTTTDEHLENLVAAIQGKDGNGGLVGRMGKLEKVWAMLIGVAIASGLAGAGFAKLLGLLGG